MGTEKRQRQRQNRALKLQQDLKAQRRAKARSGLFKGLIAIAALVVLVAGIAYFGSRGGDDEPVTGTSAEPSTRPTSEPSTGPSTQPTSGASPAPFRYGSGECAPTENPAEPVRQFDDAPRQCIDPDRTYTATFETSEGDIVVELDTENAPGTVNNFVNLARFGYYDDTTIFRVAGGIDIIQGGGRSQTDSPGYTIPDERDGLTYQAGDLVMARRQQPNSAAGQWFFAVTDEVGRLDAEGTYVTFGRITEGLDVAERILSYDPGVEGGGPPTTDVAVERVTVTET